MTGPYTRITVPLSKDEFEALQDLARLDYRHPREQARYLLGTLLLGTFDQATNDKSDVNIRQDSHVAFAENHQ